MNISVAFITGLFPKEMEQEIYTNSKGPVQHAANALQWNFVNGLDHYLDHPLHIINSLYVGSYPKRYNKLFVKTSEFHHSPSANDINVGFINLFGVVRILRYYTLKPYIERWVHEKKSDNMVIIAYAMTAPFALALKYAKKINNNINTIMIVPDLPEYMRTGNKSGIIYKLGDMVERRVIRKCLKYIDNYVLLTEHMAGRLGLHGNYVVVEGIAAEESGEVDVECDSDTKVILYTGTLNERYGVVDLVSAFKKIPNQNYRLVLCGAGDSEGIIKSATDDDRRIIFMGQLDRKDILKQQKKATILVNPRRNNEEFTKFSFPSKILEYLSSGVPVLAYKLDGIPDDYDEYIAYVNGDTHTNLAESIIRLCEKSEQERHDIGRKAREYVYDKKNKYVQAGKVIKMIPSRLKITTVR